MQLCWLCKANQDGRNCFRNCSRSAPWRSTRYPAGAFLKDLNKQVLPPNPFLNCPRFSDDRVLTGVLHALDQGVTQEVCGNAVWEALEWLGWGYRLRSARCANMRIKLQQYYKEHHTPIQIQSLPSIVINQTGQSPKFRAIGKQNQYMVPLLV